MTNEIKGVCWDIDGVFFDNEYLHTEKKKAIAENHGIILTEKDNVHLEGMGLKRVWDWLKESRGLTISFEQYREECGEYYLSRAGELRLRSDALKVFNFFDSLGVPQCAVSSGERLEVDMHLLIAGIKERMVFSVSADDVEKTKPDPEPYLTAALEFRKVFNLGGSDADNAQFIAIDDMLPGAASAVGAGMTTILWSKDPNAAYPGAIAVHTAADFLKVCQDLTAGQEQFLPVKKYAGLSM